MKWRPKFTIQNIKKTITKETFVPIPNPDVVADLTRKCVIPITIERKWFIQLQIYIEINSHIDNHHGKVESSKSELEFCWFADPID